MSSCLYVTYKVVGYDPSYGGILLTKIGVTMHSLLQHSRVPASITTANNAEIGRIRDVIPFFTRPYTTIREFTFQACSNQLGPIVTVGLGLLYTAGA